MKSRLGSSFASWSAGSPHTQPAVHLLEDLHIARGSKSARDGSGNARRLRERAGWQWHAGMWLRERAGQHVDVGSMSLRERATAKTVHAAAPSVGCKRGCCDQVRLGLHTTVEHRCLALALWAVLVPLALSRREVEVLLHQSLQCLPSRLWVQGYSVPLFNPGSDVIAGFAR